jgi:cobalt/nickel transport system permease protein
MSSAPLSPHIPDFDLITWYAERQQTFFSAASPWTKCAALIAIVLLVTLLHNLILLLLLFLTTFLLYAAAGLPVRKLLAWYTLPLVFVLSLVGILAWSEPGTPLFSAGLAGFTLTLTDNGLSLAVTLLIKALISVTFSLFFLMTTRYEHFAGMIARIFPSPLDQIFLLAYRFLFLTLAMTASLLRAMRSRGGGLVHSIRMQGRLFAAVFALIFIRSFEQGERVHRAMTARGFTGRYTTSSQVPLPAVPGVLLLILMGISVITAAILSAQGVPV